MNDVIRIEGDRETIEELRAWMSANVPQDGYAFSEITRVVQPITGRKPLRHLDLCQAILEVALGVIATGVYDILKSQLGEYIKNKRIEVSTVTGPDEKKTHP